MLFPKLTLPVGRRDLHLRLPFLAPYAHHTETVRLPAVPRGVHLVGPVTHEKADPVGLVSRRFAAGAGRRAASSPRGSPTCRSSPAG